MAGVPAQDLLSFLGIQTVPKVVSGSVVNLNDFRVCFVYLLEKSLSYIFVGQLVSCRYIVNLSGDSSIERQFDSVTEVCDVYPVPNLLSSPVKRNVQPAHCS